MNVFYNLGYQISILILISSFMCVSHASELDISAMHEQLMAADESAIKEDNAALKSLNIRSQRAARVTEAFEQLSFPEVFTALGRLNDDDLSRLLDAAFLVQNLSPDEGYAAYTELAAAALAERGQAVEQQLQRVYYAWLAERDWSRAHDFAEKYLNPSPPEVRIYASDPIEAETLPAVLRIDEETSNQFIIEPATFPDHGFVVVSNPFTCPFSRTSLVELADDPATRDFIAANAIFIMNQSATLSYLAIRQWQDTSPFELHVVYKQNAWPMIGVWDRTPVFYVLEDGQIIDTLRNWTPQTKAAIAEYLMKWEQQAPL